ncbi:uncharacterized protein BDZ83DRAFT_736481 [Colletotrichum acutatum]|uniref:Uncharacterized protein n=1 Tax=Glomerella acutata TaxID=27357 RepID=A0AAD8U4I1_GLOAC|nr:uncharacterized protein BDZ83DRAFT_736481 [Colletotrichum acutatum]KAK1703027.1 hypothetical protein BDZ83DRAFT_736481 [Colletotrichum acutatum]
MADLPKQKKSGEQSYLPSRLPFPRGPRVQNYRSSGVISRLAFSPVSLNQVDDCTYSHRLGDLPPHTGEICTIQRHDRDLTSTQFPKPEPKGYRDQLAESTEHHGWEDDRLNYIEVLAWMEQTKGLRHKQQPDTKTSKLVGSPKWKRGIDLSAIERLPDYIQ